MKGLVRIRLARFGRTNNPKYNIVVANAAKARDRKPIEVLGTYDPIPNPRTIKQIKNNVPPVKEIHLDFEKAKYWIGVGAQPSDVVTKLFIKSGILTPEFARFKKFGNFEREVIAPAKQVNK
ncbi:related to 37S ribosomal protein S16, mitochondrial [Saccharomycodes ludwigii]|uniref:Related to 37S ribosomal protein S16, mitochondrial n=1 Tax=Saccharomycodes ludwigii TaxID=36035 RepID=A0A376B9N7_9ASCO|nr:hypothetical protein SCDLUD_000562 [Saccharomycodes ludwigii]KAH3902962.1 hypothetical protein SCDLUD_000562 [Saccharomycodes ludwigii]SSD61386.1 related to 37S ribosomal protein S16, mitochondrial [Saccharomycodes ludwigii]